MIDPSRLENHNVSAGWFAEPVAELFDEKMVSREDGTTGELRAGPNDLRVRI